MPVLVLILLTVPSPLLAIQMKLNMPSGSPPVSPPQGLPPPPSTLVATSNLGLPSVTAEVSSPGVLGVLGELEPVSPVMPTVPAVPSSVAELVGFGSLTVIETELGVVGVLPSLPAVSRPLSPQAVRRTTHVQATRMDILAVDTGNHLKASTRPTGMCWGPVTPGVVRGRRGRRR